MIRRATAKDLPQVLDLLTASGLPTDGIGDVRCGLLVAESDRALSGCAALERWGADALLRSVAVTDAMRARGVGKQLVDRVIQEAREARVRSLYLLTTTAEGYFPRFGFTPVPRESVPDTIRASSEFHDLCPASATVMVLQLTDPVAP